MNELFALALEISAREHKNQFDKSGNPYFLHCIEVMNRCKSDSIEIKIIAILHDLIEDTNYTLDDLKQAGFPQEIINSIDAITKRTDEDLQQYKERVFSNRNAMIVKMADIEHNSSLYRLQFLSRGMIEKQKHYVKFYNELKTKLYN